MTIRNNCHPEVAERSEALEGWRLARMDRYPSRLDRFAVSHLRMTIIFDAKSSLFLAHLFSIRRRNFTGRGEWRFAAGHRARPMIEPRERGGIRRPRPSVPGPVRRGRAHRLGDPHPLHAPERKRADARQRPA